MSDDYEITDAAIYGMAIDAAYELYSELSYHLTLTEEQRLELKVFDGDDIPKKLEELSGIIGSLELASDELLLQIIEDLKNFSNTSES